MYKGRRIHIFVSLNMEFSKTRARAGVARGAWRFFLEKLCAKYQYGGFRVDILNFSLTDFREKVIFSTLLIKEF